MEINLEKIKEEFKALNNYDLEILKKRTKVDICTTSGIYKEKFVGLLKRIEAEQTRRIQERRQ